uniref:Mpv17-like protein n=1 Tax=Caligus clemensi TaxID=344056 RepID=C1C255_CALCM|nr:Mpv17-like protein [Caligus clemensi]
MESKYKHTLKDILLNNSPFTQIWPMAQLINFYFVPFLMRPLFVNFVALFWNSYLAWKLN